MEQRKVLITRLLLEAWLRDASMLLQAMLRDALDDSRSELALISKRSMLGYLISLCGELVLEDVDL